MVDNRSFQFHGSQIGRAKAAFEAGGYMPQSIYPIGNGMYIIVVPLPPSIQTVDWDTLDGWQQRRKRRRFPSFRRLAAIAAVLAFLIGGGWLLYNAFMPDSSGAQAAQPGFLGFQLPELPSKAPAVEPAKPLTDAIAKPIEDIKAAVAAALWLAAGLIFLALLFVLRRPLAALGGGLVGLGRMLGRGKG